MTDPQNQMEQTHDQTPESGSDVSDAESQSMKSSRIKQVLLICLWLIGVLLVLDWIWLRIIFSVPLPTVDKVPI